MVPGYHEVRELGTGGSGRVVLATYAPTGAYVAIKYLNANFRDDHASVTRLREEARIMVELRDPNVVRFHEYYEDVLETAIVMELVDGVALRTILSEHGNTSPEAALTVLKGSLAGLASAHSAGVVHRDYRPENVLIQADGTGKLTDFGIAARTGEADMPAGTPPYTAPERWAGEPAGPASDIYAATCAFFECLTGRGPYGVGRPAALMHRHRTAPIPLEAVPGSVRKLVARGMAKDPADRPPTARAFVAELETAALSAYGPEWEQRGRRHLAELATLLALTFPLARPVPEGGGSVTRNADGRRGGIRRPRLGPRVIAGIAVITAAVTVGLVAANRAPDRLSAGAIFTPAPRSPAAGGRTVPPVKPPSERATESPPPEPVTTLGPSRRAGTGWPPASSESANPSRPNSPGRPTLTSTGTPPAPTPTSTGTPPAPTPTSTGTPPAPTPTSTGTPPSAPVVSGLTITGIDADGTTVRFRIRTGSTSAVTVRLGSAQKVVGGEGGFTRGVQVLELSGQTDYEREVTVEFAALPGCGEYVHRVVTVTTVPGGDMRSSDVRIGLPSCGPVPDPDPDGPVPDRSAVGDTPREPTGPADSVIDDR
ncbi:serine/threonine-protein kinase [Streptosporangium sp. NPDC087985]|uniref:serine/threonine-protein kinase n=1 Tax=Streptosporangium sp. NPDC087985 TaxID=3366196 RepID=UPI003810941E